MGPRKSGAYKSPTPKNKPGPNRNHPSPQFIQFVDDQRITRSARIIRHGVRVRTVRPLAAEAEGCPHGETMEGGAPVAELTSGASGRIIPVFRNIRRSAPSLRSIVRIFFAVQTLILWFLLFIRRRSPFSGKGSPAAAAVTVSPVASPRRRRGGGRWAEEEEDVRRRRGLAEVVEMAAPAAEEGGAYVGCRWETFLFYGPRRTALYCRSWIPASGEMRLGF